MGEEKTYTFTLDYEQQYQLECLAEMYHTDPSTLAQYLISSDYHTSYMLVDETRATSLFDRWLEGRKDQ